MTSRFQAAIAAVAVFASLCIVGVAADEPEAATEATVTLDPLYRSPLRVGQIQVQSADTLTYRDGDGTHDATYRIVDGKTVEIRMTIDGKAVTEIPLQSVVVGAAEPGLAVRPSTWSMNAATRGVGTLKLAPL